MIYELRIPATIEDNDAVRVLEWHGGCGDRFEAGQLLVEVETHKALIEIRADQTGVLRERHFEEGAWCPLGDVIALLSDTPDEPLAGAPRAWNAQFMIG